MKNGVKVLDFYTSEDLKTGEDILVFIVNKKLIKSLDNISKQGHETTI